MPGLIGGSADLTESNGIDFHAFGVFQRTDGGWPARALRHSRARDGVHQQRRAAPRRFPRLRRHVPGLRGLPAPGGPPRRAQPPAQRIRAHARQRLPGRGRPHAPARRAPLGAAAHPGRDRVPSGGRTSRRPWPGRSPSAGPAVRSRSRSRVRTCQRSPARRPSSRRTSCAAGTSFAKPRSPTSSSWAPARSCNSASPRPTPSPPRVVSCAVVSMPSVALFLQQPAEYRDALTAAGACPHRQRRGGRDAALEGPDRPQWPEHRDLDRFGASAPAAVLAEKFGLTAAAVTARVQAHLAARK
jgi:hypothetical protein